MDPKYPLNLDFGEEEADSSSKGSSRRGRVMDDYLKQTAVYRAEYLELVLENNKLSIEILALKDQIRRLKAQLK